MQAEITLDDREINRKLALLESFVEDMTPVYAAIGNLLQNITAESFQTQSTPWGKKWLPWKNTPQGSKRKSRALLYYRGALAGRWSAKTNADGLTYGTNLPYAPVHQFGTKDGKIPARAFLPIKNGQILEDTKLQILELLKDEFAKLK